MRAFNTPTIHLPHSLIKAHTLVRIGQAVHIAAALPTITICGLPTIKGVPVLEDSTEEASCKYCRRRLGMWS